MKRSKIRYRAHGMVPCASRPEALGRVLLQLWVLLCKQALPLRLRLQRRQGSGIEMLLHSIPPRLALLQPWIDALDRLEGGHPNPEGGYCASPRRCCNVETLPRSVHRQKSGGPSGNPLEVRVSSARMMLPRRGAPSHSQANSAGTLRVTRKSSAHRVPPRCSTKAQKALRPSR